MCLSSTVPGNNTLTLHTFAIPLTLSRKRMSIIFEDKSGDIVLFCKGADNIIIDRMDKDAWYAAYHTNYP